MKNTKQSKSLALRLPQNPALSPREAIEQNVRRRLAPGFQVRPTEDQVKDLEQIMAQLARTDPRVTQADVVRGALDFFLEAWERETKNV